jgi:hypothetical protein
MNSKVPAYLYEKDNLIRQILFAAAFALLFINIFQPFGSRNWYPDISEFAYFFFSSLIILTGMLVVVISRIMIFRYTRKHAISYWQYGVWIFSELLAMAIFFTLFARFIPENGKYRDIIDIFHQSFVNTSLVLLLPYGISWLYFSWKDKNLLLKKIANEEPASESHKNAIVAFPDEKGELRLSVALDNLLYIESTDNYITVHYLSKSKQSGFTIRNSLKWVEENLTENTPLVRCYRSYIINLDRVRVLRKTKTGIVLELDADNTPDIPVSKTYYQYVMEKLSSYTSL